MTPPAAAATAPRTRTRRTTPPPRRVSGPVRGRAAAGTVAAPPPLALRLGGAVHTIAEHHLLDRLVRGRAWIAILAVGLMGIVFMQVSMLRMNAGIGAAVERSSTLDRQNSGLRASISELSSGDRIAAEASKLGLVLPPGTPRFLDARDADAAKAVKSMTPPGEGIMPSAVEATMVAAVPTVPVLADTGVAPDPTTATLAEAPVTTTDPAATTTTTTTTDPAAATGDPAADPAASAAAPTATAPPHVDPVTTGGVTPEA